ncbi:nucleotide-sugar transporter [Skeletonema marinoi]|uniref:Nucleotide-sugar transporter n=1 Tax=Skeletonema marinoi TaxID=267567 RepID=A0AAD8Y6L0_9STRA|nr:nucleotide-sugar transporter [Skeletonema marinoi]
MACLDAKYFVLVLLVVQNTCLVLLMRYSRTRPGTMYLGSTAVCCDEAMKLITCLGIITCTYYMKKRNNNSGGGAEYSQLNSSDADEDSKKLDDGFDEFEVDDDIGDGHDTISTQLNQSNETFREYLREQLQFDFRMGGLALLYTIQKNLLYVAISNLDAAVFQVTYQAKILTTALFSVLLLKRKLSRQKIGGLLLLTMGVALVQLDKVEDNASKSYQEQNRWAGVLAVLGACCTSGFGGVYFELVLKPHQADSTAFIKDHKVILSDGFFQGYSPLVILVITLEAGGGLVVAAVIKYADNILKSFATAVSIVTSTIVSMWVFGFIVSKLFIQGCLLVFLAIGLYSRTEGASNSITTDRTEEEAPSSRSDKRLPAQTSEIAMMSVNSRRSSDVLQRV